MIGARDRPQVIAILDRNPPARQAGIAFLARGRDRPQARGRHGNVAVMATPLSTPPLAAQLAILDRGDRVRSFRFDAAPGQSAELEAVALAGRPIVLLFLPSLGAAAGRTELAALRAQAPAFDRAGAPLIAIAPDAPAAVAAALGGAPAGFVLLTDADGGLRRTLGESAAAGGLALVLGPDLRVRARLEPGAGGLAARALEAAAALAAAPERTVAMQAPVLLVADALPPAWCDRLMRHWEGQEKTYAEYGADAGGGFARDPDRKRRHDVALTDPQLLGEVQTLLHRRVIGEVKKAFGYAIRNGETPKIGCYESADRGVFAAHRDNHAKGCEHRQFAMSLILNDGYEGGEVRFPEFAGARYRPAAGAALVFSCALLHEVTPVTSGRRFGLFGFFW